MIELTRCFGLQQTSEVVVDMLSLVSQSAVAGTAPAWVVVSEAVEKVLESWSGEARGSWWAWAGGSWWGPGSSPLAAAGSSGAVEGEPLPGTADQADFVAS